MQLGLVGLGKMGGNMRERLRAAGHEVVGYDHNPDITDAASLAEMVEKLAAPRAVWVMVPATVTEQTIFQIADLLSDNHYGVAANALKAQGLGLYAEAMGAEFPTSGDALQAKGRVTIPMGEFWTPRPGADDTPAHMTDMKEAASAAHTSPTR